MLEVKDSIRLTWAECQWNDLLNKLSLPNATRVEPLGIFLSNFNQ